MLRVASSRRGLLAFETLQRKPFQAQIINTSVKAFANAANEKPSYLKRQQNLGRPVSPHVTIYAFPLAAISSVTHRITGGLLTVGLYGMGMYALVGGEVASLASVLGSSAWGPLLKFSVAFPLSFHFLGGLRHFYWEIKPEQLTAQTQNQAAAALFATSGTFSLIAMFL